MKRSEFDDLNISRGYLVQLKINGAPSQTAIFEQISASSNRAIFDKCAVPFNLMRHVGRNFIGQECFDVNY